MRYEYSKNLPKAIFGFRSLPAERPNRNSSRPRLREGGSISFGAHPPWSNTGSNQNKPEHLAKHYDNRFDNKYDVRLFLSTHNDRFFVIRSCEKTSLSDAPSSPPTRNSKAFHLLKTKRRWRGGRELLTEENRARLSPMRDERGQISGLGHQGLLARGSNVDRDGSVKRGSCRFRKRTGDSRSWMGS